MVMRSSVFVADMTYIALRSKIKSKTCGSDLIWFSVRFWIAKRGWFVQRNCKTEISTRHSKDRKQKQTGEASPLIIFTKNQIGCYMLQPNLTLLRRGC